MPRLAFFGLFICLNAAMLVSCSPKEANSEQFAPAAPVDKWQVTESRSPMDDSQTVVLSVDADGMIEGPIGAVRPSLIVRCKEGKTDIYVATRMAASIEEEFDGGLSDTHKVRIRLDDGAANYESWGESTDHKALFAQHDIYGTVAFAKKLMAVQTLTFQFTPFDGSPQVARFDLRGLDIHLPKLAEACHWSID